MCYIPRWYTTVREANEIMLRQWRRGDWRFGHVEWCAQHHAYHLMKGVIHA